MHKGNDDCEHLEPIVRFYLEGIFLPIIGTVGIIGTNVFSFSIDEVISSSGFTLRALSNKHCEGSCELLR